MARASRSPRLSDPPAALPDELANYDRYVVELMTLHANLQRGTMRRLKALWRNKKLSDRGSYILEVVNAGRNRPSRLLEYFDVLPSTITLETDRLVNAGLLTREPDPNDRRAVILRLTKKGLAVHAETAAVLNDFFRPRIEQLSPEEFQSFIGIFRKIVDGPPEEAN